MKKKLILFNKPKTDGKKPSITAKMFQAHKVEPNAVKTIKAMKPLKKKQGKIFQRLVILGVH